MLLTHLHKMYVFSHMLLKKKLFRVDIKQLVFAKNDFVQALYRVFSFLFFIYLLLAQLQYLNNF